MSNLPASAPAPQRSGGLSLYANLLDPSASSGSSTGASISRGPVVFKQAAVEEAPETEASAKKQQLNAAALRFQPVKRQQVSSKPKPKSSFPKAPVASGGAPSDQTTTAPATVSRPPTKSTLADWTAAGDDDGFYGGEKRQRGGRKRRKKNKEEYAVAQDWDDIYDPSRPNNYDEYKHSEEKIREVREWKDRLYAHRMARKNSSDMESDDEDSARPQLGNQFAPPSSYSFAPPPMDSAPKPTPPADLPDDQTGEDAYARRLRISQGIAPAPPAPAIPSSAPPPPPPPPEPLPTATISRAPVRYNLPSAPSEIPANEAELEKALAEDVSSDQDVEGEGEGEGEAEAETDTPRSLRPGQKGFAERLMSKYGWSKGSGLGADGSGIINPLRVQVEKRKKKSDAEGGGFADPKGLGKIIGGKKKEVNAEVGKFGAMSEVVVLKGMVDGMDLDEEVGDGGLMQEIGDECSEKYGVVERVYIDRSNTPAKVFVKFTSQLSALRAVNALEGRIFSGNTISAMFYDTERFERGIYD